MHAYESVRTRLISSNVSPHGGGKVLVAEAPTAAGSVILLSLRMRGTAAVAAVTFPHNSVSVLFVLQPARKSDVVPVNRSTPKRAYKSWVDPRIPIIPVAAAQHSEY